MSQHSSVFNDSKQKTKEFTSSNENNMTKVSSSVDEASQTGNDTSQNSTETDFNQMTLPDYDRIKTVGQGNIFRHILYLNTFRNKKKISSGSFGVAVLYRRKNDQSLVVLKQINLSNLTNAEKELAMNEAEVFSKLHHPNIIW